MLIDFTVRNYRSIKNEVSLNMESNNKKIHLSTHVIPIENGRRHLYPFSVIYGANASGKSNVVKALQEFIEFILKSNQLNFDKPIPCYRPFRLNTQTQKAPIFFQLEFIVTNITYKYTVEFTEKSVLYEELIFSPRQRKILLFKRENDSVQYGKYFIGEKKTIEANLLDNRLLITLFGNSIKNEMLQPVYKYFDNLYYGSIQFADVLQMSVTSKMLITDPNFKPILLNFLSASDLHIEDIKVEERDSIINEIIGNQKEEVDPQFLEVFKYRLEIAHQVFEGGAKVNSFEYFDLRSEESSGTLKMYNFASIIINSLRSGMPLIIDEFNSSFHPFLCEFLISLFTNEYINTNHAQLIVATHDIHILDPCNLKREQVWFTEKDEYGVTDLFSMEEFDVKNFIRDNTSFSKYYMSGRFGALPRTNTNELEGIFQEDGE